MGNKWQITIDVNEDDVRVLTTLLRDEVRKRREQVNLVADETAYNTTITQIQSLEALKAQIELAWIEREVELIPPPSAHVPVAIDHSPPVYRGGDSREIVMNGYERVHVVFKGGRP